MTPHGPPEWLRLLLLCVACLVFAWFSRPPVLRGVARLPLLLFSGIGTAMGLSLDVAFYGRDHDPLLAMGVGAACVATLSFCLMRLEERPRKRERALDALEGKRR